MLNALQGSALECGKHSRVPINLIKGGRTAELHHSLRALALDIKI